MLIKRTVDVWVHFRKDFDQPLSSEAMMRPITGWQCACYCVHKRIDGVNCPIYFFRVTLFVDHMVLCNACRLIFSLMRQGNALRYDRSHKHANPYVYRMLSSFTLASAKHKRWLQQQIIWTCLVFILTCGKPYRAVKNVFELLDSFVR